MMIDRVTMTGADDSVSPEDLVQITGEYPEVEWGILLSKTSVGSYRFPSFEWVGRLKEAAAKNPMRLSAHLCGRWVRDILRGNMNLLEEHPGLLDGFQRVQLNFHAAQHSFDPKFFDKLPKGKQYIFQIEDVNNHVFEAALEAGIDAVPLFDTSGGAGVVPDQWPPARAGLYCGYAGGLGPDTIEEQLGKINEVVPLGKRVWIDMERRIRSGDDSAFDLGKVRQCLKLASQFVE